MTGDHGPTSGCRLTGKVAREVLQVITLDGSTDQAEQSFVDEQVERLLERRVCGCVWADDVTLGAVVLGVRRYDARTIEQTVRHLHSGFTILSRISPFTSMADWDPPSYLSATTSGVAVSRAQHVVLVAFWRRYSWVTLEVERWLYRLSAADQRVYQRFVMPTVSADMMQGLLTRRWPT